jgi:hypothetical protein
MILPSFTTDTAMPGTSNVFKVRATKESISADVITCAGKFNVEIRKRTRTDFFILKFKV